MNTKSENTASSPLLIFFFWNYIVEHNLGEWPWSTWAEMRRNETLILDIIVLHIANLYMAVLLY